ncbi:hypothetical protein [Acetobacterium sp. KB-1]|jgi:uncharacterized protein YjdB|uniref:hypothetical protein n=1 Tax=Acetobacterium sp. KB-1 TaxID=2184575 RepID=UPI000DBECDD4|nr:hypothetical protein [Acetobacterium sp. KB-1]AWW26577.1 hypothetical protein DOZ58_07910 [Acetobacterium sp. KB-1]
MKKITVSILSVLMMLSMVFSTSVFAAEKTNPVADFFAGIFGAQTSDVSDVGVEYRGHVQNKGDFPLDGTWIQGPERLGTVGEGLRLEASWIKLADTAPAGLHIKYQVHVQNKGWMGFVEDGTMAGTKGEGLRIEAIQISLVDDEGNIATGYSVEYRGHVQNIGDTEWYADGAQLGTTGSGLRLEALEIKIVQTKADMTAYEAAVAAAAALTETDYTAESWAALQTALTDNVVTDANTQAEVDAATAAINAAIEALTMVTSMTGVEATSATTLTVSFNTAISAADQALITFDVQRGSTTTTMLAPVWAADGMSVELSRVSNLLAGTYTVTAAGIDLGTDSATTVVEAQTVTTVNIITANVAADAAAQVNYMVYDQYGDEMTRNSNAFTWSVVNTTASTRTVAATDGAFTYLTLNTIANAQLGDVLRVTGVLDADTTIVATKDITVSNIFVASFGLGEVVVPEGSDRLTEGAGMVELTYAAADNFGNEVTLPALGSAAMPQTIGAIQFITSDATIINNVQVVDGVLSVNVVNDGTVVITAINGDAGTVSTLPITVYATPAANTATFGDSEIIAGDNTTFELPVVFADQYGTEMAASSVANLDLTTPGSLFNVSVSGAGTLTVGNVDATGENITFTAATEGTYTLTLVNKLTGAVSTATVEVLEERLPSELQVVTAPSASIPSSGATTTVTFKVVDQYGDDMTGAEVFTTAGYTVDIAVTSGGTNYIASTTALSAATFTSTITSAATLGTDTVTYTLMDAATPAAAVDSQAFNFTIVDPLTSIAVTTNASEYTSGDTIGLTINAYKGASVAYTTYNGSGVATISDGTDTYLRNVTFVNGVATTTVPAGIAGAAIVQDVTYSGLNDTATAVIVNAGAASQLALSTNDLILLDAYGNTADYDFTGIANFVTDGAGTILAPIDSEGNKEVVITDGVVYQTDGTTPVTFTGASADDVLTMTLANGDVFTLTVQ